MSNYNDWIMDGCGKITASEINKIMGKGLYRCSASPPRLTAAWPIT